MNITLAEGIKLKSILSKQLRELEAEAFRIAFAKMEKGSEPPKLSRTLTDVESEMEQIRSDLCTLDFLIYKANSLNTVEFEGKQVALVEAIELAIQLRAQADFYKQLASSEKEELLYGLSESQPVYRVALFDPEQYRQKAQQTEKLAHQLSNRVNTVNYSIELDFDGSSYF